MEHSQPLHPQYLAKQAVAVSLYQMAKMLSHLMATRASQMLLWRNGGNVSIAWAQKLVKPRAQPIGSTASASFSRHN